MLLDGAVGLAASDAGEAPPVPWGKGLSIKNSSTAHQLLLISFSFSFSCEIHIFIL